MTTKGSAYYQRQYRQRLRDQGFIKKEVWILPERAPELYYLERQLRQPGSGSSASSALQEASEMKSAQVWTTQELYEALTASDFGRDGRVDLELLDAAEPCLHIVMREYGDLPIFLTVSRQHILVEALLWPVETVKDQDAFNREALRTHKFFSLSTLGIDVMADGQENYIMFGSLSASSILPNIVFEIETLADNVIRATEAYEIFLTPSE